MIFAETLNTVLTGNIFIVIAVMFISGYFIANIANLLRLPKVTGYLITGIILGGTGLQLITEEVLTTLSFVPEFTLGIIAMLVGSSFSRDILKHFKFQLLAISFAESLLAFVFVFLTLILFGMSYIAALPLAAIATATAPAATISIIKQYRSFGSLTNMILAVVAIDDALAILIYSVVLSFGVISVGVVNGLGPIQMFFLEVFNSFVIGAGLAIISHYLIRRTKGSEDNVIILLSMVLFGVGLSKLMFASSLLTNMFFGFILINISHIHKQHIILLEKYTPPIYCLFFIMAGAHLQIAIFFQIGILMTIWATIFILARAVGKILGAYLGAVLSGSSMKIRRYLGWTLVPETGVAIGLTMLISEGSIYYEYKDIIINITLAAVAVNELIGPVLSKWALIKSGEAIAPLPTK